MNPILILVAVILTFCVVFVLAKKRFVAAEAKVKITDIPAIFEKLQAAKKDGSFAVFCFLPPGGQSSKDAINVQFSIEGGRIGFDWVLIGPSNIRDKDKFAQIAERQGYKIVEREMNNVRYLRVEEGNLPELCRASIRDLYSMSPDTELLLIPNGFSWP